jgi:serine/threonine protein kinase
MKGGKLIGIGSNSCVFYPNIPCKKNGKVDPKRVSKLLYHYDSKKLSKHEEKQSKIIKKIKNYKDWAIIYDEFCIAPKHNDIEKYDPEGYVECFGETGDSNPYENAQLLSSEYGGETFKEKFSTMFQGINEVKDLHLRFKKLMVIVESLFLGLKEMHKNKIIHNDIKPINIIYKDDSLKYIDFGLASKNNNIRHFRARSINEASTHRIYIYYPLEYIFLFMDKGQRQTELNMNIRYRRNYNTLEYIYAMFGLNINDVCFSLLKNIEDYNVSDVISKIDVYSLGITIAVLFYENNLSNIINIGDPLINDFFSLFGEMINPDLKQRLLPTEAYEKFVSLMKKHSIKEKAKISPKEMKKPRRATPRRATPRRATPRRATPRRATPRRATPRRATPRRATPRRAISRRATPRRATPRRATPRRATPRRAISRRNVDRKKRNRRV